MKIKTFFKNLMSVIFSSGLIYAAETNHLKSRMVVPGAYSIGHNGEYTSVTNIEIMWPGVLRDDTNGWRVQLYCWGEKGKDTWASLGIGNTAANIGMGYVWTPNEKFYKCKLKDSSGKAILPRSGATLEAQYPASLSVRVFPKWSDGKLKNRIGFFTNSPPWVLKQFRLQDVFQIEQEGDYSLTVCPVIYKVETNAEHIAYRIDLPTVTTNIHLKAIPNAK